MPLISDALAQGAAGPADGGNMMPLVFLVVMFVIFYFLLIRPQQKRQKELRAMIDALNKGDEVVTTGGLVGRVTDLSDQYLTLQVATVGNQAVSVSVQRSAVTTLLPKGTIKAI